MAVSRPRLRSSDPASVPNRWMRGGVFSSPARTGFQPSNPSRERTDRALGQTLSRKEAQRHHVRAIYRASPSGGRPRPGGGADAEAQLHRDRAHPARPPARGGGPCGPRPREPRHHRRARARPGRAHRRLRRRGHLRPDPVHPACQEGAGAGAPRGAVAGAQLHRDRAHPARPGARERGRGRAHPARLRRRLGEDPQRGHPHAVRSRAGAVRAPARARRPRAPARPARARARSPRSCSTSSGAT